MKLMQSIVVAVLATASAMGPGVTYPNSTRAAVPGFAKAKSIAAKAEGLSGSKIMHENASSLEEWGSIRENSTRHENSIQPVVLRPTDVPRRKKSIQLAAKAKLDINQKVYIEGQPTLGDGAGQGSLNKCRSFAPQHVDNPSKPHVKVCGTGIKMTAYLRGACKDYYQHIRVIGKCKSSMAPNTCDSYSPSQDPSFGAYQSYKIEQC